VTEDVTTHIPNGPAVSLPSGPSPMVTPDGSAKLTSRRPGRELFPSSWLRHKARIMYDGGDATGRV
jgi:hypothetical protein